ncbi:MAG TPA: cysteine--tRNA ligase [Solirubrobacteraceae bacterium]|jgi:cysteinyl-tRNA synthetase
MREIRLHDTMSGELQTLQPRDSGRVGIYACGPTVYSRIHIGNARPFVVFSLLKRFLAHEGYEVTLVINLTDVNDKIYIAARDQGGDSAGLATEMIASYVKDTDALGLGRPDHEPLATQTMAEIIVYIEALVERGHAYESGGDVFFRVRSDPGYGSLSHRRLEDMDQGEDGQGSHPSLDHKQDPLDFALWKAHKSEEDTFWDSPWGNGRPGWHIECSAMAESILGVGFDIHGGGSDLVFPHHENEAAQTRAARSGELAKIWMHNGMIQSTGEKMAKSVGNIRLLHEVIEEYDRGQRDWPGHARATAIMYLIGGHYRQPLAFSATELAGAEQRVLRIRGALNRLQQGASPPEMGHHKEAFFAALADDFNTPRALASLFEWVREANRRDEAAGDADLREMLGVLGLDDMQPIDHADAATLDPEAAKLAQQREQARKDRDFALADELREQLRQRGWEVRDGSDGPELIPLTQSNP